MRVVMRRSCNVDIFEPAQVAEPRATVAPRRGRAAASEITHARSRLAEPIFARRRGWSAQSVSRFRRCFVGAAACTVRRPRVRIEGMTGLGGGGIWLGGEECRQNLRPTF